MLPKTRKTLEYFVEKAQELKESRFAEYITQNGLSLNMQLSSGQPLSFSSGLPDTDAVKALTLTLRFFIQDTEPISLHNIQQLVDGPNLADAGLSSNWKNQYGAARKALKEYLNGNIPLSTGTQHNSIPISRKEIWDALLWGHYSHSNKREEFLKWKAHPFFPFIQFEFVDTLMTIYNVIQYIADFTKMELDGLQIPSLTEIEQAT